MAKKKRRAHSVHLPDLNPFIAGTISIRDVEKKIRKPYAPATRTHTSKTAYRRKPKHPGSTFQHE